MGAFIARQPNGLYCRFSSVVDCPTNWNMTEDDYIELCKARAEDEAREVLHNHLKPFELVISSYVPSNMKKAEFKRFLREVQENKEDDDGA